MSKSTRDDILPSQIVAALFKESEGYSKYREDSKPMYKHFLSCVGLVENDFIYSRVRDDLRCNDLLKQFQNIDRMAGFDFLKGAKQSIFLNRISPALEEAVATEKEIHLQLRDSLRVINAFYENEFEVQRAEFASLGPELEQLQKNRPTDPEMIQHMDKVMNRFTELQRSLKNMIRPGLAAIQAEHLKIFRNCMELYEKQNEQWSQSFALFAQMKPRVLIKTRNGDKKGKADKLGEDDRDM
ncbi:hypothetical protein CAEBREN_05192 [Caenorhabditis brenneri]|uniref:BAR domain-containing protein n=1 Tax=Caenorhabditis brenneri TaxID=135651 RepID=G0PCM0_CAEBE|nr:hypothetical protein CAEBREN_05192 [Caenorhabditis brenneri]